MPAPESVLVVGAGPVGALNALGLARAGVPVTLAPRFRDGRVLLAGDAAHATNPTGGLGLAGGMFDTFVLQEALAAVVHARVGEDVLDEYARERRRVFVDVVSRAVSNNKRLVYHSSDPGRLATDLAELRRLELDQQAAVDRLMFTKSLETPSLIGAW